MVSATQLEPVGLNDHIWAIHQSQEQYQWKHHTNRTTVPIKATFSLLESHQSDKSFQLPIPDQPLAYLSVNLWKGVRRIEPRLFQTDLTKLTYLS